MSHWAALREMVFYDVKFKTSRRRKSGSKGRPSSSTKEQREEERQLPTKLIGAISPSFCQAVIQDTV
jgi:hypothetical protein